MSLTYENLKEVVEYLSTIESYESTRKTLLIQTVAYLNNKYPKNLVTMDLERELLNIEGDDRESILNDLEDIGLIKIKSK